LPGTTGVLAWFCPGIDFTGTFTGTAALVSHHLVEKQKSTIGAGGGTRTHTTFYGPRILSPVRLPFRHTGNTNNQHIATLKIVAFEFATLYATLALA
jgi:hypothetical protein